MYESRAAQICQDAASIKAQIQALERESQAAASSSTSTAKAVSTMSDTVTHGLSCCHHAQLLLGRAARTALHLHGACKVYAFLGLEKGAACLHACRYTDPRQELLPAWAVNAKPLLLFFWLDFATLPTALCHVQALMDNSFLMDVRGVS
eukprot:1150521-Pelagomonas_calceolata.AAC.2